LYNFIYKIFSIIPKFFLSKIILVVVLTFFNTMLELLNIGLVIPFLSIFVGKKNILFENLNFINGFTDEDLIILFILLFLIIYILKNFFLVLFQSIKINITHDLTTVISTKLYNKYLNKNYYFFTGKNKSELSTNIINETNIFSFGVVMNILNLICDTIIFSAVLIFLLYYNWFATICVSIVFIFFAFVVIFFQSKQLKFFGVKRQYYSAVILKLVNESVDNIKEIILSNTQEYFRNKYSNYVSQNNISGKRIGFYRILIRPILEILVVFMFLILVYFLKEFGNSTSEILITIAVFSVASIKLLPTVTSLFNGLQGLRYNEPVVEKLYSDLNNENSDLDLILNKKNKNLYFKKIELDDLSYSYPGNPKVILNKVNFEINSGEKIGLIGKSGSGKTTLLNIMIGLIKPQFGTVKINNEDLSNNIRSWQDSIGYVSQNIYLADESLLFNIAFKRIGKKIDYDRIKYLIDILDLNQLITSNKNSFNFNVGDGGIKLSGGQVQRIGIARALYHKPSILILDEATSAIDEDTKEKILKNIYKEMQKLTVISVSHDLKSLKYCQKIFKIVTKKIIQVTK
jgi:ABC-type bacteriocin/lantibiotic exporter with double-glycine peptidase domain